jgi:hypothetical protein
LRVDVHPDPFSPSDHFLPDELQQQTLSPMINMPNKIRVISSIGCVSSISCQYRLAYRIPNRTCGIEGSAVSILVLDDAHFRPCVGIFSALA